MDELNDIRRRKLKELEKRLTSVNPESSLNQPVNLTDSTFHETIRKYPLIVIDCWAAWCAPCRMVAPIIDELAREYAGKIVFGKLNTDENRATAINLGIMGIPTILIFSMGNEVDRVVGALTKEALIAKLQKYIPR